MGVHSHLPQISVIVPARNEEECLGRCLESLVAQTGAIFEIIVVDDDSSDRTRQIAESFDGVRVIDAGPLRSGWTGKNNAMRAGATQAHGAWLLFTDADTVHLPGSVKRSLTEAVERQVELLSFSPEQEVHGFWEKAVMPVIFAELTSRYRLSDINDPESPSAAANGQYILVSREAYEAVGGQAVVAGSLLEDVALARAFKQSGYRIFFRYGGDAVRTRMYRSFGELREGWTKNLVLLFPSPVRLAVFRLLEFWLILASCFMALIAWRVVNPSLAILFWPLLWQRSAFSLREFAPRIFRGVQPHCRHLGFHYFLIFCFVHGCSTRREASLGRAGTMQPSLNGKTLPPCGLRHFNNVKKERLFWST